MLGLVTPECRTLLSVQLLLQGHAKGGRPQGLQPPLEHEFLQCFGERDVSVAAGMQAVCLCAQGPEDLFSSDILSIRVRGVGRHQDNALLAETP